MGLQGERVRTQGHEGMGESGMLAERWVQRAPGRMLGQGPRQGIQGGGWGPYKGPRELCLGLYPEVTGSY